MEQAGDDLTHDVQIDLRWIVRKGCVIMTARWEWNSRVVFWRKWTPDLV